ncbi:unnamed protein product [Alternaria burnsii]|nr:unnamed protein product [Alternaria burnsii]
MGHPKRARTTQPQSAHTTIIVKAQSAMQELPSLPPTLKKQPADTHWRYRGLLLDVYLQQFVEIFVRGSLQLPANYRLKPFVVAG